MLQFQVCWSTTQENSLFLTAVFSLVGFTHTVSSVSSEKENQLGPKQGDSPWRCPKISGMSWHTFSFPELPQWHRSVDQSMFLWGRGRPQLLTAIANAVGCGQSVTSPLPHPSAVFLHYLGTALLPLTNSFRMTFALSPYHQPSVPSNFVLPNNPIVLLIG